MNEDVLQSSVYFFTGGISTGSTSDKTKFMHYVVLPTLPVKEFPIYPEIKHVGFQDERFLNLTGHCMAPSPERNSIFIFSGAKVDIYGNFQFCTLNKRN